MPHLGRVVLAERGRGKIRAAAFDGVVDLLSEGVEDDADEGAQVVHESEGDTDVWVAVDEVGSPVYGVTDESGRSGKM